MNIAVIFAGGVGSRMRSRDVPKQFLEIHGTPIIVRTVDIFQKHPLIDLIIIVCVKEWIDFCRQLLDKYRLTKVYSIEEGGATGQDSIYHGLIAAESVSKGQNSIVLIHDGVRPLINEQTITDNISAVKKYGSAITSVLAKETVLEIGSDSMVQQIPARASLRLARAPQSFWLKDILGAHRTAISEGKHNYIDSASMMFDHGFKLYPVEGPYENIKITTPEDFFALQAILNSRENAQIYGI